MENPFCMSHAKILRERERERERIENCARYGEIDEREGPFAKDNGKGYENDERWNNDQNPEIDHYV